MYKRQVYNITKEVVSNVKIPVMVKLSQNTTNIASVARAVKRAGGSGVSAINTIRCILSVDIENRRPSLATYGGYSGAPIRPLGLASVAAIAQTVDIPICGIGGIENATNVVEYMLSLIHILPCRFPTADCRSGGDQKSHLPGGAGGCPAVCSACNLQRGS